MDLLIFKQKDYFFGDVAISGSKNSALALLTVFLLTNKMCVFSNVPQIDDVNILLEIFKSKGHYVLRVKDKVYLKRNDFTDAKYDKYTNMFRASYYLVGASLSFYRDVYINGIGGCNIGSRPIDYHIDSFKQMNISCNKNNNHLHFHLNEIKNTKIYLKQASVGTTINIILASTVSNSYIEIHNSSIEPEVIDLIDCLNKMNANIKVHKRVIKIYGVKSLSNANHKIISDRIEAGTFLALAALPNNKYINVTNVNYKHLKEYIKCLRKMNINIKIRKNEIRAKRNNILRPINIKTNPYPQFSTDLAPIISTILTFAKGRSKIQENIYLGRFSHVKQLNKLGAKIKKNNNQIIIYGVNEYKNAICTTYDLRCSAACLIAGINAAYNSFENVYIKNINPLFRGYEDIIGKLNSLGIICKIIN